MHDPSFNPQIFFMYAIFNKALLCRNYIRNKLNMTLITTATTSTSPSAPAIDNGCLLVGGKVVLTSVPPNVLVSPATASAFVGATSASPSSYHVFNLGTLQKCRFMCLFRAKIWWMIPRVGDSGSEIPLETQFLLLEMRGESVQLQDVHNSSRFDPSAYKNTTYILFLPVLDGQFRASLQGTPANELQLCVESGDTDVQTSPVLEALYVNSGSNPFELIKNSVKILEKHKGTITRIEHKKIPEHLNWFGWCTWDAFYRNVNPQGIFDGLQSFSDGGCPPKYLIIDDGWQEAVNEYCKGEDLPIAGAKYAPRLADIKENRKFKNSNPNSKCNNLREFIRVIKEKYGLKYVYMWHALTGYWGGVLPTSETMKRYNPKMVYPIQSPGNIGNLRDIAMDYFEEYGIWLVDPKKVYDFYNNLHSYLASCGADGVKVDVQNVMETLGSGYGGRVTLTKQYQEALEQSVANNFKDNNLICCMSHNTESIYSSKASAVARASEDFMPKEPTFHTLHIASVAFNSLLLGEIVVPDWDMFMSTHETAEFHGAGRAIGGCAVYASDKPGHHNFKILKRLVLPDGSILRARHAARPTRDILFADPVMDGKSLMKIWNLNMLSGIIGVFNCQGAGSWPMKEKVQESPLTASKLPPISCQVSPLDVEYLEQVVGDNWNGDCAVYAFNSGSLSRLQKKGSLEVSLRTLEFEIFTISPIRVFGEDLEFGPIGLVDMYNSGGAVQDVNCITDPTSCTINIKGRGCGRFGSYSSVKPKCCLVDGREVDFAYNIEDGMLIVEVQGECSVREIGFVYGADL